MKFMRRSIISLALAAGILLLPAKTNFMTLH